MIIMIHDPQYLVWSVTDREYKAFQQKLAKWVFKENKEIRKQIKSKKSDLKDNSLTIRECGRLWVKKAEIMQREKEWKIKWVFYNWKMYYSRQDIANCM